MKKTFNPLARMGFDLNVSGCILTPGSIYLPLLLENMEITLINTANRDQFSFDGDEQIRITEEGFYYIVDPAITQVIIDISEPNKFVYVTSAAEVGNYLSLYDGSRFEQANEQIYPFQTSVWTKVSLNALYNGMAPEGEVNIPVMKIQSPNAYPSGGAA